MFDFELDILELGERVTEHLGQAMLGQLYSKPEDRAWAVVLECFRVMWDTQTASVPDGWMPQIDDKGIWVYSKGFKP